MTRSPRLVLVTALVGLSAALTACSSSKGTGDAEDTVSPTPAATTAAVVTFTPAQAKAALLVASDLPAGYTIDNEYTRDELPGGCAAIDAAIAAEKTAAPTYVATSFDKGDNGFSIDEEIGVFTDAAEAKSVLDGYVQGFAGCPSWTASEQGMTGTLAVTLKGSPAIGDEAKVFSLSASSGGQTFEGTQYIVLQGNTLVFLAESGPSQEHTDPAVNTEALATTLVDRLKQQAG